MDEWMITNDFLNRGLKSYLQLNKFVYKWKYSFKLCSLIFLCINLLLYYILDPPGMHRLECIYIYKQASVAGKQRETTTHIAVNRQNTCDLINIFTLETAYILLII